MGFPAAVLMSVLGASAPIESGYGEDLAAWHRLQFVARSDQLGAYRQFIQSYPGSPLAENAWVALGQLDGQEGAWTQGHELVLRRIDHSASEHRRLLARTVEYVAVVPLDGAGHFAGHRPSEWTLSAQAGGAWSDGLHGRVGLRADYGAFGFIGRLGVEQRIIVETGVRLSASVWGPYVEALIRGDGQVSALVGGRVQVFDRPWLEASAGLTLDGKSVRPLVLFDLSQAVNGAVLRR